MANWKLIEGIESSWVMRPGIKTTYEVSDDGQIRNARTGRLLALQYQRDGYLQVSLSNEGESQSFLVHRLVATAWCKIPKLDAIEINHIDGIKDNNSQSNLEWVTHQENMIHAINTGLWDPSMNKCVTKKVKKPKPRKNRQGINNTRTKLTESDVLAIRARSAIGESNKSIADDYPVTHNYIGSIIQRYTWKHI